MQPELPDVQASNQNNNLYIGTEFSRESVAFSRSLSRLDLCGLLVISTWLSGIGGEGFHSVFVILPSLDLQIVDDSERRR